MPLTNRSHQALLNSLFSKTSNFGALASVPTVHVGLSSTTPTMAGANITEPSTGAYARVATVGADWGAATDADPSVLLNAAAVEFPTATADWVAAANLTHFTLHDAATAGNVLGWGALDVAKPVLNGDTATFAIGELEVQMKSPA